MLPFRAHRPLRRSVRPEIGRWNGVGRWAGLRVGILGGSFNPAHEGHRHISLEALRRLKLDYVWWMVSPQNPLKDVAGMASFDQRLQQARKIARHPRIIVTDVERRLGSQYTADTLALLTDQHPQTQFVWLMGADNLESLHLWHDWEQLVHTVPFAIFDRPKYSIRSVAGKAARRLVAFRIPERMAPRLAALTPPAWVFFHIVRNPLSATQIRAEKAAHKTGPDLTNKVNKHVQTLKESQAINTPAQQPSAPSAQQLVVSILEDNKAEDIVQIDLQGKTSIADVMIIANGNSQRQVGALAGYITDGLKEAGFGNLKVEGLSQKDWVLIDAGDVIIHLFRPEVREFYNLEKMWTADFSPDKVLKN